MLSCNPLEIKLTLSDENETRDEIIQVEVDDSIESFIDDWIDDYNDEHEAEFELDSHEIVYFDSDYANPDDFGSLNEYGEYIGKCLEHGEAYVLRYEDVGDHDFEDEYNGCWDSEEEFVQNLIEDCYTCDDFISNYIDWEKMTRDVMMDYSSYHGDDGYHIFRD
jgi:antirestriction protein